MLLEDLLLFLLDAALLLLNLLLLVDDSEELVALLLGLLSQTLFSLEELPLSSVLEVAEDLLFVLEVPALLVAGLSLPLLEGALGSEGVDLGLSVGSLLLELSETSDLTLLLLLDPLELGGLFFLAESLLAVIFNDLLLQVLLLLFALVLDLDGALVGLLDLAHHLESALLLGCNHLMLLLLDLFGLSEHLLHLSLAHLLLLDALELAFLDLVDDHEGALLLGLLALDLALLLELEGLESLDLHHEVKALLLLNPLLLEALGLLELPVSDGDDLGVEHHLVHVLHVIVVLVEHLLGLGEESVGLFLVDDLLLGGGHLECALLIEVEHPLLSGLGGGHG